MASFHDVSFDDRSTLRGFRRLARMPSAAARVSSTPDRAGRLRGTGVRPRGSLRGGRVEGERIPPRKGPVVHEALKVDDDGREAARPFAPRAVARASGTTRASSPGTLTRASTGFASVSRAAPGRARAYGRLRVASSSSPPPPASGRAARTCGSAARGEDAPEAAEPAVDAARVRLRARQWMSSMPVETTLVSRSTRAPRRSPRVGPGTVTRTDAG